MKLGSDCGYPLLQLSVFTSFPFVNNLIPLDSQIQYFPFLVYQKLPRYTWTFRTAKHTLLLGLSLYLKGFVHHYHLDGRWLDPNG